MIEAFVSFIGFCDVRNFLFWEFTENFILWTLGIVKVLKNNQERSLGFKDIAKSCYLPCYMSKYRLKAFCKHFSTNESAPLKMNLLSLSPTYGFSGRIRNLQDSSMLLKAKEKSFSLFLSFFPLFFFFFVCYCWVR